MASVHNKSKSVSRIRCYIENFECVKKGAMFAGPEFLCPIDKPDLSKKLRVVMGLHKSRNRILVAIHGAEFTCAE